MQIDIGSAEDVDRAVEAAKRDYERVRDVPDWTLHADEFEVETMAPVLAAVSVAPRG